MLEQPFLGQPEPALHPSLTAHFPSISWRRTSKLLGWQTRSEWQPAEVKKEESVDVCIQQKDSHVQATGLFMPLDNAAAAV